MNRDNTAQVRVQRWWLEPGAESCPFCAVRYHLEAAYHCSECDRAFCPACVVEVFLTRRVVCPDCGVGEVSH